MSLWKVDSDFYTGIYIKLFMCDLYRGGSYWKSKVISVAITDMNIPISSQYKADPVGSLIGLEHHHPYKFYNKGIQLYK